MNGCGSRRARREKLLEKLLEEAIWAELEDEEDDDDIYWSNDEWGPDESEWDEPEEEPMPMEGLTPHELGKKGEDAACELLRRKGYHIIERNWTCPFGEADIIALDEGCLVFVEVKTRAGVSCGLPTEAVTPRKRQRYERIAACYLSRYDGMDSTVRFDVIGIQVFANGRALARHVVNAFGVGA